MSRNNFLIDVRADKDARTITVSDNGIGMTEEEMEKNLGVIANSGSFKFKKDLAQDEKDEKEIDIIGQFGVGFHSAFMVSDKVRVVSRAYGPDTAYCWESSGADGYTVTETYIENETVRYFFTKDPFLVGIWLFSLNGNINTKKQSRKLFLRVRLCCFFKSYLFSFFLIASQRPQRYVAPKALS